MAYQKLCFARCSMLLLSVNGYWERLALKDSPLDDETAARVTKCLMNAILNSSALRMIRIERNSPSELTIDRVHLAPSWTDAVKSFVLCFHSNESAGLLISRKNPWKLLLSIDNVPFGLWPRILAKRST